MSESACAWCCCCPSAAWLYALDFSATPVAVMWAVEGDADTINMFGAMHANGRVYVIQTQGPYEVADFVLTAVNASTGAKLFNVTAEPHYYVPNFPLAATPDGAVLMYGTRNHMFVGVVRARRRRRRSAQLHASIPNPPCCHGRRSDPLAVPLPVLLGEAPTRRVLIASTAVASPHVPRVICVSCQ